MDKGCGKVFEMLADAAEIWTLAAFNANISIL